MWIFRWPRSNLLNSQIALGNILKFRKKNWQFDTIGGFIYFILVFSMFPQVSYRFPKLPFSLNYYPFWHFLISNCQCVFVIVNLNIKFLLFPSFFLKIETRKHWTYLFFFIVQLLSNLHLKKLSSPLLLVSIKLLDHHWRL